jgi:tetratricopeptide (TPR) repeat protein
MPRAFLLAALLAIVAAAQEEGPSRRLESARRLKQQRSFQAAAQAYRAVLPALRSGSDRGVLAHALLEYGQASLSTGDYAGALGAAQEAVLIFHDLKDAGGEAQADNVSGSAQLYNGDYDGAIHAFEGALQLDRRLHDAQGEITRLSNIGNVYFFQGKYLDAQGSYERALARVEETSGKPWNANRRELVLTNLATLYEQLGQYQKALEYYQRALAGSQQMGPSERAQLLSNAGTLYRRLGDAVKALETYRAAQALYAREHLSDGEIHVLQDIGIALALDFQDLNGAVTAFSKALASAEASANRREAALAHLFRGEAFYRMKKDDAAGRDFAAALGTAHEIGAREEQWTALYGIGRIASSRDDDARAAAAFREAIAIIESIRTGMGHSSLKTDFLADKRQVYDAMIDLTLRDTGGASDKLFGMFEEARSRNLQDSLGKVKLRLSEVQSALPPRSMLLEYWLDAGRVAVLWIAKDASGLVTRPLTARDIEALSALPDALQHTTDSHWRGISADVGKLLLGGVPLNRSIEQLLIVPDGILSEAPFEVLSVSGGEPALLERFAVSYLPSAALLLRSPMRERPLLPWQRRWIGFGNPVVNAKDVLPNDEHWSRLPDSARELQSIRRVLPGGGEIHSGEGDLKRYLFNGLAGVPMLHFSTHASIDFTDPNLSRILFTPEPGRQGSAYLFRSEVQALPLASVDLVTLSACDTERGRLQPGEGVQSFSRAFLAAGARSTVTTLWRVADGPAADLMRLFYSHLARGETKAESLRAAKLNFLHSGTELALPEYWAAFVITGDAETPIRPVLSWMWFVVPAVAAAALISFLSRRRFRHRLRRCFHRYFPHRYSRRRPNRMYPNPMTSRSPDR